jgi:hypothetical protein
LAALRGIRDMKQSAFLPPKKAESRSNASLGELLISREGGSSAQIALRRV